MISQPLLNPRLGAIVLAAGLGKRMRSKTAKVLHPVAGRPMVLYSLQLAQRVAGVGVVVVVGHQGEKVREVIKGEKVFGPSQLFGVVDQPQLLGTGDAVKQARKVFTDDYVESMSAILILNGDTPLLTEQTIEHLLSVHQQEQATVTVLTATLENPTGYGRVVRSSPTNGGGESSSSVVRIVEDRDAQEWEAALREVNVGTYVVDASFLFDALDRIEPNNAQQEYYLTDMVKIAVEGGRRVSALTLEWAEEGLGINSRTHLVEAERIIRHRIVAKWLDAGVTIHDPATTWIDADVRIGPDTVLYPHVTLEGHTKIGDNCTIRSYVRLTNCQIGDEVNIQDSCVAQEATIEEGAVIGPFAHLRPGTVIRRKGKVGNFVEMKQAELGEGSKANHLTYLGNAKIGRHVNIGAGSITCNYDGVKKHQTVIGDDVFVGSNTLFVAPVSVGRGALLAAGTTVTEDVPENAMAVSRAKQVNKKGWASRRRALLATAGQNVNVEGKGNKQKAKGKK